MSELTQSELRHKLYNSYLKTEEDHNIEFDNDVSDMTPKQATKAKIDKSVFQLKIFGMSELLCIKELSQKANCEIRKRFTNHIVDKGLISRVSNGVLQLNNRNLQITH